MNSLCISPLVLMLRHLLNPVVILCDALAFHWDHDTSFTSIDLPSYEADLQVDCVYVGQI